MVKDTPSLGRIAAMVGFALSCFGLLLFLWLSFGGSIPLRPEGYRFTAAFPEASTLVQEADVRLAGVNVGKVRKKELDKKTGRTIVELEIDHKYAPIPRDTRAILRQKTLLGETYVELTPGNPDNGMLGDGEQLAKSHVDITVELDEIYRIFDEPTRKNFARWIKEGSVVVSGDYGQDLNDAIGNLAPFATDGAKLLEILNDQEGAVRGTIKNTGRVFNALAAEEGQLRGLIENGNETFDALASRDEALAQTFEVFPTFLRESRATLARLETFSRDTHPLVNQLKGPVDDLGPTVRDLGDLAPDLERLFRDLNPLIAAGNRGLPDGTRFLAGAQPLFQSLHVFLPELNPVLAYLSFSKLQVAQFLTVGGAALAGQGTGGYQGGNPRGAEHWLPQIALIDSQSFSHNTTRPSSDRGNAYVAPNAYERMPAAGVVESFSCPGGEIPNPKDTTLPPPLDALGVGAEPPCFVAPPLLYQRQKYPRLRRGAAPVVAGPRGLAGTEPPGAVTLTRRALVSTAAGGAALLAAGCGDEEEEPRQGPPKGDLDIVNYALTLEFLEEDFYEAVVASGVLSGREQDLAKKILENETEHVEALTAVADRLGTPVDRPATTFDSVLSGGRDKVIGVAADLENTGAGAYLAEASAITSEEILASALAIHTVEARHASILNLLAGRPPLPDGAFAETIERAEVQARIARFLA